MWGRNDMLVPVEDADEYERADRRTRGARSSSAPGTCAMLERPARFNRLLREFLPRTSAAAPFSA